MRHGARTDIIASLSAAGRVVYARVVRGEVLSVKQGDFVQAASALGVGRARLPFRRVLPIARRPWGGMLAERRDFLYVAWCTRPR